MQAYLVGGAVRDRLLGRPVTERDWVVVGATIEQMRARGFVPVDRTFPVFRHPATGDEYALARVEHKRAPGHRGFDFECGPEITLEQDLARRDLTVNAIAQEDDGTLHDPFDGVRDLHRRRLRHVTPAFADDPLRLLRAARFASTLHDLGFHLDEATRALMKSMANSSELTSLSSSRVWRELERAMGSASPRVMFDVLRECGAAETLFPAMPPGSLQEDGLALVTLTRVAAVEHTVDVRVAALVVAALPPERRAEASAVARGLNAPVSAARASAVLARLAQASATIPLPPSADSLMQLLELCDAFRRPDDFVRVLPALNALDVTGEATQLADQLTNALPIALRVKVSDAFLDGKTGAEIGAAIRDARIAAIAEVLTRPDTNPRPAG